MDTNSGYGKEIPIQKFGYGVVFRKDAQFLSFKFIGVFTTKTDCRAVTSFVWTEDPPMPTRVPLGSSVNVNVYA